MCIRDRARALLDDTGRDAIAELAEVRGFEKANLILVLVIAQIVQVLLLALSVFLAAFSGLYFTVYAVTDEAYRDQFFSSIKRELERAVGVRAVYLALRNRG